MRLYIPLVIFILLFHLSTAKMIAPKIYEQDDLGDPIFKEFTYAISADCTAGTITTFIFNESNKPVRDATVYIQYIDFSVPLISNVVTDAKGYALHKLPGDVKFMHGLFVMVVQKKSYRSKEVHFDLSPCYSNGTIKPPVKVATNNTNKTNLVKPVPISPTSNQSNKSVKNETAPTGKTEKIPICPGLFLLGLGFASLFKYK